MSLGPQSRWKNLGVFLNKVYSQWHNILEKEEKYFEKEYHTETLTKALGVIKQFERGQTMIYNQAEVTLNDYCKEYNSLGNITSSTSSWKARLSFRGHWENLFHENDTDDANPKKYNTLSWKIANYCPNLKEHMSKPLKRNATYLSPTSQNKPIGMTGMNYIQEDLVWKIKKAGFYLILAWDEIFSICFQFVDTKKNIRKVLLIFLGLLKISGVFTGGK